MEPHLQADPLGQRLDPAGDRSARREAGPGLYVHVPFCARRCAYCDFDTGALSAAGVERYLAAMERECAIRAGEARGIVFDSVFFGGGTPSALSARHFRRLWSALRAHFSIRRGAEITLEANPESVGDRLLEAWSEAGVNRLSMGAQSFDPEELVALGRIHSAERPAAAFAQAREHGFTRLSLDLMFGFPGHVLRRWRATVESALELAPEHLSAYCYIPEPGTPLGDEVASGRQALPEAEEQADAYAWLTSRLEEAGYSCYETSNFCRAGGQARHNLTYWLRRPYLGLGPSAHGLFRGDRYGNLQSLPRWAAALESGRRPEAEVEPETPYSIALEVMMLGLRLADGIHREDYPEPAWREVERRYRRPFQRALETGRLEEARGGVRIPGSLRFTADDVIAWIEAEAERGVREAPRFDRHTDVFLTSVSCHSTLSPGA